MCQKIKSLSAMVLSAEENIKIVQFWYETRSFVSLARLPASRMRLNPLTYMGWSQAIPRQWRVLAADGSPTLTEEDREEAVCINYRGKTLVLCLVSLSSFVRACIAV